MLEHVDRALAVADLDGERVAGLGVRDGHEDAAVALGPQEADLDAVADAVVELADEGGGGGERGHGGEGAGGAWSLARTTSHLDSRRDTRPATGRRRRIRRCDVRQALPPRHAERAARQGRPRSPGTPSVLEAEADLQRDLVVRDAPVRDVAPHLGDLEPVEVAQRLRRLGDGPVDRLRDALRGGARDLDGLVDVVAHGRGACQRSCTSSGSWRSAHSGVNVSPRKNAGARAFQATISTTPTSSVTTPITKTPPIPKNDV